MHGRVAAARAEDSTDVDTPRSTLKIDPREDHAAFAAHCRDVIAGHHAARAEQFDRGESIYTLVRANAADMDALLVDIWKSFGLATESGLALVAVGGFGRGELHPYSDVDLMVLAAGDVGRHGEVLSAFLTLLWDLRVEVGHSVRSLDQCAAEAAGDITIATNLVESRLLYGDRALFEEMRQRTRSAWTSQAFFEAKWDEQRTRHRRFHDTAYNLEPNVKEGPGGLRDLQMIGWVAKRHFGAESLSELVTHGFLTEAEFDTLHEAQGFLWRVRYGLHLVAGRREDRLLFDHQSGLAARLGYSDKDHNLAVEQFMQLYYRTIRSLSRLNEMLLELFQEELLLDPSRAEIKPLNRRFQTRDGFLEIRNANVFARFPFALLEMFLLLQQNPGIKGVRATTIRAVRENLHRIDDEFRADLRARSLFLEIIRQPRGITHEFQRMHDYGVLAAYLPVFGNVTGQMQYDLFHVYTVDQHTLFVVRNLRCFFVPERFHEFPRCSALVSRLPKPELLYLGGLFHDIAKGREGDHSTLGADDAQGFCLHHGMSKFDANFVAWLVENHLLMSVTAQRRDISDPDVIEEFANAVGDRMHLDYLYLLTVADIRATNPSLWNDWKDSLLWDLYQSTVNVLRREGDRPVDSSGLVRETQEGAKRLLGKTVPQQRVRTLWRALGDDYFLRTTADEVAWHANCILEAGAEQLPLVVARSGRGGIDIFIYAPDQHYLFSACTAQLERLGLNILDARIITADNGMTLDSFVVEEMLDHTESAAERYAEITQKLRDAIRKPARHMPSISRVPKRQLKHFRTTTTLKFTAEPERGRTIMEIITGDRTGLLSRIGWAMAACHVSLTNAKIATFGERAEDIFYVCDRVTGALEDEQVECLRNNIHKALGTREKHDMPEVVTF